MDVAYYAKNLSDKVVIGTEGNLGDPQNLGVHGEGLVGLAVDLVDLPHGAAHDGDVFVIGTNGDAEYPGRFPEVLHGHAVIAGVLINLPKLVKRVGDVWMSTSGRTGSFLLLLPRRPSERESCFKTAEGLADGVVIEMINECDKLLC